MGHTTDYRCTKCKNERPRDQLLAKKVSFLTLGAKGKTVQSRTSDWICYQCLADGVDEHWNLEAYNSPGLRSAEEQAATAAEVALARRQKRTEDQEK